MTKRIGPCKWIVLFLTAVLAIFALFGTTVYVVDPYFQYRVRDHVYFLNTQYAAPGLVKNGTYDMLIIGSSVTQNFDMDVFREEFNCEPLHIGIGGTNWKTTRALIDLANRTGKAKDYYICVDLVNFTNEKEPVIPAYLLEDSIFAKMRYTFSYEPWFRFMPVDLVFVALRKMGYDFPLRYEYIMSVDRLGDWSMEYPFGEQIVLDNYKADAFSVSEVDTNNLLNRMLLNIDRFLQGIDAEEVSYHFFFPPYSALYWCDAQTNGYYDEYIEAKHYFIRKVSSMGCEVYDFQSENIITDLNHYRDVTHYDPDVNVWMTRCFAEKKCLTTPETCDAYQQKMIERIEQIREKYRDVLA